MFYKYNYEHHLPYFIDYYRLLSSLFYSEVYKVLYSSCNCIAYILYFQLKHVVNFLYLNTVKYLMNCKIIEFAVLVFIIFLNYSYSIPFDNTEFYSE